jgi:zeaxanthin glucosyltransferase
MQIGLVIPDFQGHLNPGTTLGSALKRRGHQVTLISPPNGASSAKRAGIDFVATHIPEHESGELVVSRHRLAELEGMDAFRHTTEMIQQQIAIFIRDLPKILDEHKFDALLIDEIIVVGASIAEAKGIPVGTLANALTILCSGDTAIPPFMTTWQYNSSWIYRLRNTFIALLLDRFIKKETRVLINEYRLQQGLPELASDHYIKNRCIQLAQQPGFFEFPRDDFPKHFFYTSPWHAEGRDSQVDFPWDRLNGKPLLYASLGTVQNKIQEIYCNLAQACVGLDAQLVLSLGKRGTTLEAPQLPEDAIVVDFAPQLQLMRKAIAVVSHCGMNTALEAIACGLPVVAIPIANDQPGVAARLVYLGAAVLVSPPSKASPDRLRAAVTEILKNPSYGIKAKELQNKLQSAPTHDQTAELIEVALKGGKPLSRQDTQAMRILDSCDVVPKTPQQYNNEIKKTKTGVSVTHGVFFSIAAIGAALIYKSFLSLDE